MKRKQGSSTHGVSRSTCASLRGRDQQLRASQLSWDKVGRGQLGRWHKEQLSRQWAVASWEFPPTHLEPPVPGP